MNPATVRCSIALLLCLLLPAGCKSPFHSHPDDYGPRIPLERIQTVQRLPIEEYTREEAPEDDPAALQRGQTRFEGLDSFDISLEQVRAWTLENNLDLRIALINPEIANQAVTEEEARFESVFTAGVRRTETQQPTALQTVGSEVDTTNVDFGLEIPMRTGGRIDLALPINETATNNPFATLDPSLTVRPSVSITQPLLRNAGRRSNTHGIRVASIQAGIEQARTKLEVIRQIAAADRAYWRLYAARRALDVRVQQYDLAVAQLERARRRVRAGQDADIEIIRAEAGVAERIEAIILSENDVLLQQRSLKRIINAPDLGMDTHVLLATISDPDPLPYLFDPTALTKLAMDNRMEMLELELQLAIDSSSIDFQRNQALPLFVMDFTYRLSGLGQNVSQASRQVRDVDFQDWSLGLSAEIPIGNEAAKARVARAVLTRLQRLSTLDARRLAITQETLDALDQIDAGWRRIIAARQSAILAGRTLEAEQRQFDVGMRTSTDVLDAATRLADAQLAEIRALAEYQIAQIDLAFATGTLLGAARVDWTPLDPRGEQKVDY